MRTLPALRGIVAAVTLAACAAPVATPVGAPASGSRDDFNAAELREPAVFVRVEPGAGLSDRDRSEFPENYEGTLLEALNANAIVVRDVRKLRPGDAFDIRAAAARAREVGADHAIIVDARVTREERTFCERSRRRIRAPVTVWRQSVEVVRAADGRTRFVVPPPGLESTDLEPDCDDPNTSARRSRDETIAAAVDTLLRRLLGPFKERASGSSH